MIDFCSCAGDFDCDKKCPKNVTGVIDNLHYYDLSEIRDGDATISIDIPLTKRFGVVVK